MNRKVLNFILTFIILITMIFGLIGAKNISFEDIAEKPLYINLGKSKDNKGYAIKRSAEHCDEVCVLFQDANVGLPYESDISLGE